MLDRLRKLLREPLALFLVLGALVFAVYSIIPHPPSGDSGRIVITRGQLASMRDGFALTWQRQPTRQEWERLVRERVREEVYYREALALGLDKDDSVIRRRLQQKMEFIADDVAARAQPTDEALSTYLTAHADTFRVGPTFRFRQIYLNPQTRGDHIARDAAQLVATLNRPGGDAGWAAMGDAFLLGASFNGATAAEVSNQFGGAFAARLAQTPLRQWVGPIESSFGSHVVYLADRSPGRLPTLNEARGAVTREWEDAQRREANQKAYEAMLRHYTVAIE